MKKILLSAAAVSFFAAQTPAMAAPPAFKSDADKTAYLIGYQIGSGFKRDGLEVDLNVLNSGLKDALAGDKSPFTPEEAQKLMGALQQSLQAKFEAKRKEEGKANADKGKAFLADNAKKPGVKTLPSGLQYKVLNEGKGDAPKATDKVTTHYKGTLIDGTEFDSSYGRGKPATFPVNGVIKGWTEALQLMKPGAKWQLFVPSELAYGENGAGDKIGPNATLLFDVELISVEKEAAPAAAAPAPQTGTKK